MILALALGLGITICTSLAQSGALYHMTSRNNAERQRLINLLLSKQEPLSLATFVQLQKSVAAESAPAPVERPVRLNGPTLGL